MTSHSNFFSNFYVKITYFLQEKITYFFTREKLRTFLQGKNYVLFTGKKLRTFLQGKNYVLFYIKTQKIISRRVYSVINS